METETTVQDTKDWRARARDRIYCHGSGEAFYGLGFIGALVCYLTTATSLLGGFIEFLKAIVWPASLIYGALKFLGM
jgi:hypothetical protein